jgi:hypothetical protein
MVLITLVIGTEKYVDEEELLESVGSKEQRIFSEIRMCYVRTWRLRKAVDQVAVPITRTSSLNLLS